MANRGYTTNSAVAAFLGLTLTAGQQSEADTLIGSAEQYIDRETRRGWILPPITGERYNLTTPTIYLRSHPITSVQSIVTRTQAIGDAPYTAIAGVDYEVFDLLLGQINFSSGFHGPRAVALVSYTPNLPVPADIALCATLIVAETLARALFPGRLGVKQADPERGVRIVYTAYGDAMAVPPLAQGILDGYRTPII
jgi:hypothetical protein